MSIEPENADDAFELLLRQAITKTVISGKDENLNRGDDIIVRLMRYEQLARQERLSSQTIQVILSGRRLMGD